jgi:hypothetical protein
MLFDQLTNEQCANLAAKKHLLRKENPERYKLLAQYVHDFKVWLRRTIVNPIPKKPAYRIKGGINAKLAEQYYLYTVLVQSNDWHDRTESIKAEVMRQINKAYMHHADSKVELRTEKVRKWMFIRINKYNEPKQDGLYRCDYDAYPTVPLPRFGSPVREGK